MITWTERLFVATASAATIASANSIAMHAAVPARAKPRASAPFLLPDKCLHSTVSHHGASAKLVLESGDTAPTQITDNSLSRIREALRNAGEGHASPFRT